MAKFRDIPQFTRNATYAVDIGWDYLAQHYANSVMDGRLNVSPDFQRGYVWQPEQKVRFIEFSLRGGATGRNVYTNCRDWRMGGRTDYVLVDGKQRLDAILGFLNNEFPIFEGQFYRDFEDRIGIGRSAIRWHVNDLETRDEVLQWYIDLNAGGTIHSPEEIERVRELIGTGKYVAPSEEEIQKLANLDRKVVQDAMATERGFQERMDAARAANAAKEAAKPKKRTRKVTL